MMIKQWNMFWYCTRSAPTSLLVQERLEFESHTFWTLCRTAETTLTSNDHIFCIRTLFELILDFLESLYRALSKLFDLDSIFILSVMKLIKQYETISKTRSNGTTSAPLGSMCLVRVRVGFYLI